MDISTFKSQIQTIFPDSSVYTLDSTWINWLNTLKQDLWGNVIERYSIDESVITVSGQSDYTYPTGVTIEDIYNTITIDNVPYEKIDGRSKPGYNITDGYYFYDKGGKLYIYPTPTTSDLNIELPVRYKPDEYTVNTDTIEEPLLLCEYWIKIQIKMYKEENVDALVVLYNVEEEKLRAKYDNSAPMPPTEQIKAEW